MKLSSLSTDYRNAVRVAAVVQVVMGLFISRSIDAGVSFELWWRAVVAFWGVFIVMILRRPYTPTKVDLILVRWGFIPLFLLLTPVVLAVAWRLLWSRVLPL